MTAIRLFCFIILTAFLSGCAFSPGMKALDLNRTDSISGVDGNAMPKGIQVINADLIVRMQYTSTTQPTEFSQALKAANQPVSNPKLGQAYGTNDYVYRVGAADILSIIVWEHPELTIPAGAERTAEQAGTVVENDGTIYFPYAGVVQVAGKTLPEIRALLTQKLSVYIEGVKLDVRMAQYNNKRVYIVGEVNQPSVHSINNIPPTLVEMINASGGFTDNADSQTLTLSRDGETYRIDLLALYEKGDQSQNVLLQSGDVVNVWDRSNTKVFVLGEVNQPGSYFVNKGRKSLAEALSDAGGVNPNTSNPGQVFVFRQQKDKPPEVFQLDARSPDALLLADQFALNSRDVIYVDTASVVRWSRIIQNISGTMSTLNQASQTNFPLFKGDR